MRPWLPYRVTVVVKGTQVNQVRLLITDFPGGSNGKASACNVGDQGSIPGMRRSSGEGNGNPLQYPCLENPRDRRAWYATVHGVSKSRTRLSDFTHSLTPFPYFLSPLNLLSILPSISLILLLFSILAFILI